MDNGKPKTREEWHLLHSQEAGPIEDQGWLWYPDGASAEANNSYGLCDFPADEHKRALNALHYWKLRLEWGVKKFNHAKEQLHLLTKQHQRMGWSPPRERIDAVKALRDEVHRLQQRLEAAERVELDTRPAEMLERERQFAEAQAECKTFLNEINRLEV